MSLVSGSMHQVWNAMCSSLLYTYLPKDPYSTSTLKFSKRLIMKRSYKLEPNSYLQDMDLAKEVGKRVNSGIMLIAGTLWINS